MKWIRRLIVEEVTPLLESLRAHLEVIFGEALTKGRQETDKRLDVIEQRLRELIDRIEK